MMSLTTRFTCWCVTVADKFSHAYAIIGLPILCLAWLLITGRVEELTLILSILAITLTQMVLQSQKQETELNKLQMAELILAIPGASDQLASMDNVNPETLQALKDKQHER